MKWSEIGNYAFPLSIALIAFLVYVNSIGNGFVGDDHSIIQHNPVLREENPLQLFNRIDTPSDTMLLPYYRPLTYLTFWLEWRIHNLNPQLMHLANVIIHSLNSLLVFFFALYLLRDKGAAFISGLLFAIHPVNSETVNFLSGGRNTLLACLFSLSAFLVYKKGIEKERLLLTFLSSLLFLAGVFSKEIGLMLLPFIFVLGSANLKDGTAKVRRVTIASFAFYIIAAATYLFMRWKTLSYLGIQSSFLPGLGGSKLKEMYIIPDLGSRLADNIYIIPRYLLIFLLPYALNPRYVIPSDLNPLALPLLIGWLFIAFFLIFILTKERNRATFFGISWAIIFWLPVSGLFVFSSMTMAERFIYMPSIGVFIVIAALFVRWKIWYYSLKKYVFVTAIFIIIILGLLTFMRNKDWESDLSLFTRLVRQYPDNQYGHLNLAAAYLERRQADDLDLAEKELEASLSIDPMLQEAYTPMGLVKLEKGDFDAAVYYYTRALEFFPLNRDARINRAIAYEKLGMLKEALADYRFYLTIPTYNNIPGSYEYALLKVGEIEERIKSTTGVNRNPK